MTQFEIINNNELKLSIFEPELGTEFFEYKQYLEKILHAGLKAVDPLRC